MAVYRYQDEVTLKANELAQLQVALTQAGIAAHHFIDLPGPNDKQGLDECLIDLGKINNLSKERTLVISKAVSVNPNDDEIGITYSVNGKIVANHSNSKADDPTPMIVLTLNFKRQAT
jgi:hypothetical protein